jgi:hypothetical protein
MKEKMLQSVRRESSQGSKFCLANNERRRVYGVIIFKERGNGTVHVGDLAEKTRPATDGHIIARKVFCCRIKYKVYLP